MPGHSRVEPPRAKETARQALRAGYSLRRYYVDEFYSRHAAEFAPGGHVLDLGGNKIRKRGQFDIERYDARVVYANLSTANRPDVQADAAQTPFRESTFDIVICAELLEHVRDPQLVLREAHRVLQVGGILLATTPFLYRIHADPYDFGRYTDHYWHCALREIGFAHIMVERQGLFFSVLADFLKQYLNEGGVRRGIRWLARWGVAGLERWSLQHEQQQAVQIHPFLRSFTTGFGIVAIR